MIEEARLPPPCDGWQIGDHFGDITEMVACETMSENLLLAENMKKLKSRRRTEPKVLRHPASATGITGDSRDTPRCEMREIVGHVLATSY
ncbi:MAG: hypothetical protein KBE65_01690 [Phycisphaerae bacterium]|nr:hypothetical protein [Phycisphaerae bacterium]